MQQIYYIHNIVQNATNILYTQRRQMVTINAPKLSANKSN